MPTNELSKVVIPDTMILFPQLIDFNVSGNIDFRRLGAYNTGGESVILTTNGQSQCRIPWTKYRRENISSTWILPVRPKAASFRCGSGKASLLNGFPLQACKRTE
jgi:hypothetical protein